MDGVDKSIGQEYMTEFAPGGIQKFEESDRTTYDSTSMFPGVLDYSYYLSTDSGYPTMGATSASTKIEGIMDRPTPSSLPWNEIQDWYEFCVETGKEPYFRLGKKWLGYSVPQQVYLDAQQDYPDEDRDPSKRRFFCLYPDQSCWKSTTSVPAFSRSADLQRHYIVLHHGSPSSKIPCDYSRCSRRSDPFSRKDHLRDHYKEYHKEDLGEPKGFKSAKERGRWEEKQREWDAERKIDLDWWRCPKCLDRVEIKKNGWNCTTCKRDCDTRRKEIREKLRSEAATKRSPQIPISLPGTHHTHEIPIDNFLSGVDVTSNPKPDCNTIQVTPPKAEKRPDPPVTTSRIEASIFSTTPSADLVAGDRTLNSPAHLRDTGPPLQEWALKDAQVMYGSEESLTLKYEVDDVDAILTHAKIEPGLQVSHFESPLEDLKVDGHKSITKRKRKLPKPETPRYDCPITKRAVCENDQSSQNRGCAPMGLEFRHVWQHIKNAHYGCETCGKSLKEKNADRKHLRERERDPTACTASENVHIPFEIGIDRFDRMEVIYEEKLPHKEKWIKWWQVTHPSELQVPDPLHHGKITISAEDIPQLQDLFNNMWLEEQSLPSLDSKQTIAMKGLVEKLFRLFPTLDRHRHQRQRTKAPPTTSTEVTPQSLQYHANISLESGGMAEMCDLAAIQFLPECSETTDVSDYLQAISGNYEWNFDGAQLEREQQQLFGKENEMDNI